MGGFTGFNPAAIVPIDTDGDGIPDTGLVDPDRNGVSEIDLQTDAYNYNGSDRDRAGDLLPIPQAHQSVRVRGARPGQCEQLAGVLRVPLREPEDGSLLARGQHLPGRSAQQPLQSLQPVPTERGQLPGVLRLQFRELSR